MARNTRRSNGMKKIQPAVQTCFFNTPSTQTAEGQTGYVKTSYIDLSQCASLLNRRFYRQGISWAVASIKVYSAVDGSVTVSKLPNTWAMSNAWEKGFRVWQRMNQEAMDEADSIKPRFLDYKIYADAGHHQAGVAANLLPKSIGDGNTNPADLNEATPGIWDMSKMIIPKTDGTDGASQREIIAVGASYPGPAPASSLNAVSLIEGYAASRALPSVKDPNMPADASSTDVVAAENWMSATFNEGTDQSHEVLEDLVLDNNIAPYPFENDGVHVDTMYPGGANQLDGMELHGFGLITGTTVGSQTSFKGGMFPCGLIRIDHVTGGQAANLAVVIDLIPGPHRGYLCEPMTDM